MRHPTRIKIGCPIVDGILCVRHTKRLQIFAVVDVLDVRVARDCNIDSIGEGSVEVAYVSTWISLEFSVETDVVMLTVGPFIINIVENQVDSLVGS